ncbi:alpha/beta fold hydrolase [Nocardia amikacinitolerans]|uniref:alpha/beta fold hydrolase n=1 Tax=Nocardia amikacinitolerans TaxID=756689 RepID=UPI0020A2F477|nr:alpha/beta hydrolase [Nocardia amikacinitolerans]MCP2281001.1 Pimeloyl-ACP methyl ester carboxylesterase [Nocardia amikacinitolerans]
MTDQTCDAGRGITLCFRTYGDPADEPLMLVAGLGLDLTAWPVGIVDGLTRNGFHVVAFDNRDAGASTRMATPPPGLLRQLCARPRPDAYDLGDMAADTLALLDHLEIGRVHLVGMSMGGMIAQTLAARYPHRVRSLTSIFSTTGDRHVGQPARSTLLRLLRPPVRTVERSVARYVSMLDHIASATYPYDRAREEAWATELWYRSGVGASGQHQESTARQISAIQKSGDRTDEVRTIAAPTLVVHGDRDLMVHPSGGEATAATINGARHVVIAGMGHHLPPGLDQRLVELITDHAKSGPVAR